MTLKQRLSKISFLSISLVAIFALVMTYVVVRSFAAVGPANLYTSPSGSQSVTNGSNFTVTVRINTASNVPVSAAAVHLAYPADKLSIQNVSFSGSPYNLAVAQSNSGGVLRIDRAALPLVQGGNQVFAKVTFKATANGSANISFANSTYVVSGENDSNLPINKSGVTYNISTPSAPTSSSGSSSGTPSPGSDSSNSNRQSQTSSSSSQTSDNTQTQTSSGGSTGSTTNQPSLNNSLQEESAATKVQILVVDGNQNPVKDAEVIINGQTARTNESGIVEFSGIAIGEHEVVVDNNGKKTFSSIQVKGASFDSAESFTVEAETSNLNPLVWVVPPVIGMMIAALFFFLKPWLAQRAAIARMRKRQSVQQTPVEEIKLPSNPNAPTPGSTYTPDGVIAPPPSNTANATAQPSTNQDPSQPPR